MDYYFHAIANKEYAGVVTVLDGGMEPIDFLWDLEVPQSFVGQRVLVDLGLRYGICDFRFAEVDVTEDCKIDATSCRFRSVSPVMVEIANGFLRQRRDLVMSSILTAAEKAAILD